MSHKKNNVRNTMKYYSTPGCASDFISKHTNVKSLWELYCKNASADDTNATGESNDPASNNVPNEISIQQTNADTVDHAYDVTIQLSNIDQHDIISEETIASTVDVDLSQSIATEPPETIEQLEMIDLELNMPESTYTEIPEQLPESTELPEQSAEIPEQSIEQSTEIPR